VRGEGSVERNLILAGVGGQGILSIAFVIDNAALEAGYEFKQAEVHGMSQRGGAVQSNLRYADHEIHSDLIPAGRVDMVLSVEPLEVMRYWQTLSPEGWVVSSVTPYVNIPDYPPMDELLDRLAAYPRSVLIDAGKIAQAAGSLRAQNMVVLGAASPLLGLPEELLLEYVRVLFAGKGEKVVGINERAFAFGRAAGLFFRGLADAGMSRRTALELARKMDPATIDPALAPEWSGLAAANPSSLQELLAGDGDIACDRVRETVGS
jgi:Pyruvate:ferredoxin oxidoreductase and related 2-oxoacid:ferredoxin oxidoreductases, gamma subunit